MWYKAWRCGCRMRQTLFPDVRFHHVRSREPVFLLAFWLFVLWWDANGWLLLSLIVSVLHELGHICVYYLLTGECPDISIGFSGICMYTQHKWLPRGKEFWITAAGPFTNGVLAYIGWLLLQQKATFLRLGWVWANVLIGLFNLLPIPPLDGWHMLHLLLKKQ